MRIGTPVQFCMQQPVLKVLLNTTSFALNNFVVGRVTFVVDGTQDENNKEVHRNKISQQYIHKNKYIHYAKLICLTKYTFLNNGNPLQCLSMTIAFGDMVTLRRVALELNYMDSLWRSNMVGGSNLQSEIILMEDDDEMLDNIGGFVMPFLYMESNLSF